MTRPIQSDGRVHGAIVGCRGEDGRWLLIRRCLTMPAAPGKVCFPGGAIEVGESREAAAVREFREEVGVEAELVRHVWHHVSPAKPLVLWGWLGRLKSYDLRPDPKEVHEVLWLDTHDAAHHPDALPFHNEFVFALEKAIGDSPA